MRLLGRVVNACTSANADSACPHPCVQVQPISAPYSAIFWCHVVLLAATTLGALYIVLFVNGFDMSNYWMVFLWRVMPFLIPVLLLGRTVILGREWRDAVLRYRAARAVASQQTNQPGHVRNAGQVGALLLIMPHLERRRRQELAEQGNAGRPSAGGAAAAAPGSAQPPSETLTWRRSRSRGSRRGDPPSGSTRSSSSLAIRLPSMFSRRHQRQQEAQSSDAQAAASGGAVEPSPASPSELDVLRLPGAPAASLLDRQPGVGRNDTQEEGPQQPGAGPSSAEGADDGAPVASSVFALSLAGSSSQPPPQQTDEEQGEAGRPSAPPSANRSRAPPPRRPPSGPVAGRQ